MLTKLISDYLRRHWAATLLVGILQFLQVLVSLLLPRLTADIIDHGIIPGDIPHIWRIGAMMLTITAVQGICMAVTVYLAANLAMGLGQELRERTFHKVLSFSATDVNAFGPASLVTRATNDTQQVQMTLMMMLTLMVIAPLMCIGGIIMAIAQDAKLSLLLLVVVPLLGGIVTVFSIRLGPMFARMQARLDEAGQLLRQQLTGVRVIRAFNRQESERERFAVTNTRLRNQTLQISYTFAILFPVITLIMGIASAAVLWFGALRVDVGGMPIGALVAYINYLMQIMFSVLMAGMIFMMIPRARVCAERISKVLATQPAIQDPAAPLALPTPPYTFRAEAATVKFGDAADPSLANLDLVLAPGTTTAVVGPTGSGKTTLINLLTRFVDPTAGAITLNGVDIRRLRLRELRSLIALAPQAAHLFRGTIASNVASLPQPKITDEVRQNVRKCLEIADAWEFVETLEEQLDAPVGAGGSGYSGGQRQRLTIARAIYKILFGPAQILIIDDSFSALDLATDARVRAAINAAIPQCTKLIVAQRLTTVLRADQILVLEDGETRGLGKHADLLESCPTYAQIAESQLEGAAQ